VGWTTARPWAGSTEQPAGLSVESRYRLRCQCPRSDNPWGQSLPRFLPPRSSHHDSSHHDSSHHDSSTTILPPRFFPHDSSHHDPSHTIRPGDQPSRLERIVRQSGSDKIMNRRTFTRSCASATLGCHILQLQTCSRRAAALWLPGQPRRTLPSNFPSCSDGISEIFRLNSDSRKLRRRATRTWSWSESTRNGRSGLRARQREAQ